MRLIVALLCLGVVLPAGALTVYKGRDANGNIILSDSPFPGSVPMEVHGVQTMPLPKVEGRRPVKDAKDTASSYNVTIASPQSGQVFRKAESDSVPVGVSVTPELSKKHRLVIMLDGHPVAEDAEAVSLNLAELERGSHVVTAQVLDEAGKVFGSATSVSFQVDQTTLYNRTQAKSDDKSKPDDNPTVPVIQSAPQAPMAPKFNIGK